MEGVEAIPGTVGDGYPIDDIGFLIDDIGLSSYNCMCTNGKVFVVVLIDRPSAGLPWNGSSFRPPHHLTAFMMWTPPYPLL